MLCAQITKWSLLRIPFHQTFRSCASPTKAASFRTLGTYPALTNAFLLFGRNLQQLSRWRQPVHLLKRQISQSAGRLAKRSKKQQLPFEIDSNVSQDIVVYTLNKDTFYKLVSIFGMVQFILWGNIAFFTYSTPPLITKQGRQPFPEGSWWAMISGLQSQFKDPLAVICLGLAFVLLYFSYVYPMKSVAKMVLLRGGENIRITTYGPFGWKKAFDAPLENVNFLQSRQSQGASLYLKVKGRYFHYVMDKREGKFHNKDLFDYAVGLQRIWKSK